MSVSAATAAAYPAITDKNAAAQTVIEIQEQRKSNEEKINELEAQLATLEGDKKKEKEFQTSLYEQISLIQDNINLLNDELGKISDDINSASENIYYLDMDINKQQAQIEEKIEVFKDRLCKIYMSSNESIASIILGSASFYDMMSRVQMMNRMSEYDEELITGIIEQIDNLEQSKNDIEKERIALQLKMEDQERKISEKADEINALNAKMVKTTDEINRLALEQEKINLDKDTLAKNNAALKAEEEKINAAVLAQKQETEKRLAEEAEKKAAEKASAEAKIAKEKADAAAAAKSAQEAAEKAAADAKSAYEKTAAQAEADKKAAQSSAAKKAQEEAAKAAAAAKAAQEAKEKAAAEAAARQAEEARKAAEAAAKEAEEAQRAAEEAAQKAAEEAAQQPQYVSPYPSSEFIWPAPGFSYITSGVGPRWGMSHNGIDIGDAGIYGGAVVASKAGTVVVAENYCPHDYGKSGSCGCGGGYGRYVVIDHGGSYTTLYGHMSNVAVSVGQYVEQGEVIGYVGTTGWSTGPHLHFEIRINNVYQDPEQYVSP